MLKVGDTVACINAKVGFEQYVEVKEGETYTVSWVGPYSHYIHGDYLGVRLAGIDRGECPHFGYINPPFSASRFKPVVKPKTVREVEDAV